MRNISRGLDCPLADFTTGAAQLFLYCRQHTGFRFVVSFCNSRRPFWAERGKWAQSAQLYISPGCLSLSCILHRVGILQTLRAAVYYGANHWYITTVYCISYTDMSCISCQPTARNRLNKTFRCQHHGLDSRLLISKKWNFQKPPKLFTVMIID